MKLDEWQSRLTAHFEVMGAQRKELEWPLFALEHGLTDGERNALAEQIRRTEAAESLAIAPLPWIVYAAEVGYQYSGEEYWRTFASETPNWPDTQRDRDHVRRAFRNFARRYRGAEPEGAWAEHFSIIAWPITHSILPRDLQRQLAELLYYARLTFREETFASAESLGRHLAEWSGGSSARFRQFAKDTALLGQIALALLLHDEHDPKRASPDSALIHPPTLERIIADLNRERDARDWLIEARSAMRFRIRGLSRIPLRRRDIETSETSRPLSVERNSVDTLGSPFTNPRFLLRSSAANRWQPWVQFPNLAAVAAQIPGARDTLARVQGRVGRSGGPILASGRILSESWPAVRLSEWPSTGGSMLHFDGAPPELRSLLDANFRVPAGDDWLFIIGSDGQARQLSTRVVRPGESYLLLQRTRIKNPAAGLVAVEIACAGLYAIRIDIPRDVPETLVDVLTILGLEIAQSLEVWPVGLPVPDWSGDGAVETLVGDPLTVAVRTDRQLAALKVALDDGAFATIAIDVRQEGQPSFLVMPALPEGKHRLTLAAVTRVEASADQNTGSAVARRGQMLQDRAGLRGALDILVRSPRQSQDGGETGALSFAVHPRAPSLEDLWEDRCELHVSAPGAESIRCRLTLLARSRAVPLAQRTLRLIAPTNTETWRQAFGKQVKDVVDDLYDEAHTCVLEFSAGSLGRARLVLERDFTPLRWIVRNGGGEVLLVDARGESGLKVVAYDCHAADIGRSVDPSAAVSGIHVPVSGALFCARSGSVTAAVVAVPRQRVTSFTDLVQRPEVQTRRREPAELESTIRLAALWERARLGASSVTSLRRDSALNALHTSVIAAIAGERWALTETAYRESGDASRAIDAMRSLMSTRRDERGLAAVLAVRASELILCSATEREEIFISAVTAFVQSPQSAALARFALRLAASPSAALEWTSCVDGTADISQLNDVTEHRDEKAGALHIRVALEHLLATPVILRAARLAVLSFEAAVQMTTQHTADSADRSPSQADSELGFTHTLPHRG